MEQAINSLVSVVISVVLIATMVTMYFLPALVAFGLHRQHAGAIIVLNAIAGWTFFGWIAAVVWACADPSLPPTLPATWRPQSPTSGVGSPPSEV